MTSLVLADRALFNLRYPDNTQMTPMRIGWSLAQQNRFNGHALRPYSHAEHALLVRALVERAGGNAAAQLCALLQEGYKVLMGDCSRPLRALLREETRALDMARTRYQNGIWRHFGLTREAEAHAKLLQRCELVALATERHQLLEDPGEPWEDLLNVKPEFTINLSTTARNEASWEDWRDQWIDAFYVAKTAHAAATHAVQAHE